MTLSELNMESRKRNVTLIIQLGLSNLQEQAIKILDASNAKYAVAKIVDTAKFRVPNVDRVIEITGSKLHELETTNDAYYYSRSQLTVRKKILILLKIFRSHRGLLESHI